MFQLVALHYRSHTNWMTRHCRLPRTHLARTSMLLSSTSRTSSARPPRSSSTPCMIPTAKALTLSVVTPSASGREPRLLSLTACGLTSLTMMLLLRWSSLVRGTPGTACSSHDWSDIQQQFSCINKFYWPLFFFVLFRYVDAVMTVPKGTLFPMCGMNLAFDRDLIGPAMYFGLMGDGQPIGRYDDMWAGWCMKVCVSVEKLQVITMNLLHDMSFLIAQLNIPFTK